MFFFFFFNDTATTEIYTLSLHDALPILPTPAPPNMPILPPLTYGSSRSMTLMPVSKISAFGSRSSNFGADRWIGRSEEHTSELQSRQYLVCRLLLEKKQKHDYTETVTDS